MLVVIDDGPGAGTEERKGIGLTNTRERLATLYGARASLVLGPAPGGGTAAVIRMPWRELEER